MLACDTAADAKGAYLQISDDSVLLSMKEFCAVIKQFGEEYLRALTEQDLKSVRTISADRRFPGCVGSIECQHYEWDKYLVV